MKNILFVNYSLGVGGIETLLLEHCRYLNKLGGYRLFFLTFESSETNLKKDFIKLNVEIIEARKKPGIDLSIIKEIIVQLKNKNIQLVHAHNQNTWLYCALACFRAQVPLILTIHSGVDKYKNKQKSRWKILSYILSKITTKITTVSQYLSDDLQLLGINKKCLKTIYNGIDISRFNSTQNLKVEANSLLLVARFVFQKNHSTLLNAIEIVKEEIPDVRLYLAGTGDLMEDCKVLVKKLGIENNVIFLGYRKDIGELLQSKMIYILPSIIEGLSISLLEAMASKKAIIASNIPSNLELIENHETGLLVEPLCKEDIAKNIIILLNDEKLRDELSINAYQKIKNKFTFEMMMDGYISLYSSYAK